MTAPEAGPLISITSKAAPLRVGSKQHVFHCADTDRGGIWCENLWTLVRTLDPGPGPWTRPLDPGPWTWTLDLDLGPGPWTLDPGTWALTLDPAP